MKQKGKKGGEGGGGEIPAVLGGESMKLKLLWMRLL